MLDDEKGLTVVEMLVTIAVFALVLPSLFSSVIFLANLNKRAQIITQMNVIAQNKLEDLRNEGYNSLNDGSYDFETELATNLEDPKSAEYTISTPTPGQKIISLDVSLSNRGKVYDGQYQTIIGELGVAQ